MLNDKIIRQEQPTGIFTPNEPLTGERTLTGNRPVKDYCGYIDIAKSPNAGRRGKICAGQINANIIGDFEKDLTYCMDTGCDHRDKMVHVSTFKRLDGMIYMTYYANTGTDAEDPKYQEARLAFCKEDDLRHKTVVTILKAGDILDGKTVDRVYDTVLLYKGGDELYILFTASVEGLYYRFYCTFDRKTLTLSGIRPNRFKVGNTVNDFSITGIQEALANNGLSYKWMASDIGIMQKITTRTENGETYYYTGAYSYYYTCIIKSKDFITWEYVSTPDFPCFTLWENACYVWDDKVYYYVRQDDCMQGVLTYYDLIEKTWAKPFLVRDQQSRGDFFAYNGELYLVCDPNGRKGFGVLKVDRAHLENSTAHIFCDMRDSLFYPYTDVFGDEVYISYTVDRYHIRLSKFNMKDLLE